MKATLTYNRAQGPINVECEADSAVELCKQMAQADELFGDLKCKARINDTVLESDNVIFHHRVTKDDGYDYLTLRCEETGQHNDKWKLRGFTKKIGQYNKERKGQVFLDRKPTEGEIPGYNGWSKYVRPDQGSPSPSPAGGSSAEQVPVGAPDDIPF